MRPIYSTLILFTPTSAALRGFDSEGIYADRIQRIDRTLILNVANSSVTSSTQRRMPIMSSSSKLSSKFGLIVLDAPSPMEPREYPHIPYGIFL